MVRIQSGNPILPQIPTIVGSPFGLRAFFKYYNYVSMYGVGGEGEVGWVGRVRWSGRGEVGLGGG